MSSYSSKFNEFEDDVLLELAASPNDLNHEASHSLYNVLVEKGVDLSKYEMLHQIVEAQKDSINNLDYLKNIGFTYNEVDGAMKIVRTVKAQIWDVVSVIIGTLFMLILGLSIPKWQSWTIETISSSMIFGALVNIFFGILGFFLFYKGMNRLIEYSGFLIEKGDNYLSIKINGSDIIESNLSDTAFYFDRDEDRAILGIDQGSKTPLIVSKENPLFMDTLESLYQKLTN